MKDGGNTVHIKSKFLDKKKDRKLRSKYLKLVTPQGLEPQLTVPKTVVLPLHHGVASRVTVDTIVRVLELSNSK